jgi:hypothetical protein
MQLLEVVIDDLTGIVAVVGLGPHRRKIDLDFAVRHAVFEIVGSPAGTPVEEEPLLDRPSIGFQVERKHTRVRNRIVGPVENVVRFFAAVVHGFIGHFGDGADVVAQRQARHASHVAILALNALLAGR